MSRQVEAPPRSPQGDPSAPRRAGQQAEPMSGAFRIARLLGIDVYIHWSWFFIAALFTWSLATGYLPEAYEDWSSRQRWVVGAITAALFFGSVLAHELSHSVLARRRDVPVQHITLFIFGGVSSLGGEARNAKDEFWIAFVGPLTSFAIAALMAVVWFGAQAADVTVLAAIAGYLAYINLVLGVFNLVPGFPLDGGRVLRSILWGTKGNLLTATRIAANVGRGVAAVLIGLGVLSLFGWGGFGGVWFILIGWFLWNAAEGSYQQLLLQNSLHGLTAASLMEPSPSIIPPTVTMREFANDYILRRSQRAFFVGPEQTGPEGIIGLVTLSDLQQVPESEWDTTSVYKVMTPRDRLVVIAPSATATEALELMASRNINQVPVVAGRQLQGMLTRAALIRAIQFRSQMIARQEREGPAHP